MAKYRVWTGDDPEADDNEILKNTSSLAEAIKFIRKNNDLDEYNSGLQVLEDAWDEWLDEDDQNIHEHLYMYGGKSCYLQDLEEDEEDDDDVDLDEDEDDIEEVEDDIEDDEDVVDEDLEERLMDVIGGGKTPSQAAEEEEEILDEEEVFDDEDDFDEEDDFEEEDEEKEI